MKTTILVSLLALLSFGTTFAQRIAYVDTEYILSKMPEFEEANKRLENYTVNWHKQIAKQEQEVIALKAQFEQNKLLMPENVKIEEQEKVAKAEQELLELKQKVFGANGDLFQQQQNLIQPIQDKIYNAVKKLAERRDFDYILDKATGVSILYVKPQFDMSEEVLKIVNASN